MRAEENIYAAELLLPEKPLRKVYRKIRENPAWYLRPELVQDCIARGGCCGRDCRCCESRHINHNTKGKWKPGAGHCTVECHCCCKNRGFPLEGDERQEVSDRLRKRLSSRNPSYLLALSESYFCMPGRFAFGKPSIIEFLAWVCYYKPGFSKWRTIRNWRKIPEKMNEKWNSYGTIWIAHFSVWSVTKWLFLMFIFLRAVLNILFLYEQVPHPTMGCLAIIVACFAIGKRLF